MKFKHCHLDREKDAKRHPAQVFYDAMSAFKHEMCLCPDAMKLNCKGKIAKAHSISFGKGLARITENGHVFALTPDVSRYSNSSKVKFGHLLSAKKASTFGGFCEFHDSNLFRVLDIDEYSGSKESSFLAGYRALCREIFLKKAARTVSQKVKEMDRGEGPKRQIHIQSIAKLS